MKIQFPWNLTVDANTAIGDAAILYALGDIEIGDIYDYMSSLSKFRKGDSTQVMITRGHDTLSLEVVFE